MKITNREILTFCDLVKLRFEYADFAQTRNERTKEIIEYHTVYSLLESETTSFETEGKKLWFK